jgi:hypothetical protein
MPKFLRFLTLSALIAITGCAWQTVKFSEEPLTVSPIVLPSSQPVVDLSIEDIRAFTNDTPTNVSLAFPNRFAGAIRSEYIFSKVYLATMENAPADAARLVLEVRENLSSNSFLAGIKGFFIGLSLYTLSPVIPFTTTGDYAMVATLELPDGSKRVYTANTEGKVTAAYFAFTTTASGKLAGELTQKNIESIVGQMKNDPVLVRAVRSH